MARPTPQTDKLGQPAHTRKVHYSNLSEKKRVTVPCDVRLSLAVPLLASL